MSDGSKLLADEIQCNKMVNVAQGVKALGKLASKQDIEAEEIGKGVIIRSPNGNRWRILVSDTGVLSALNLDA